MNTEYSQREKQNIVILAITYEYIFVKYVGDESKMGYCLRLLESGNFETDEMIRDLNQLSGSDLEGPEKELLKNIMVSYNVYKENGASDDFTKDVISSLMTNEKFAKEYKNNPMVNMIFTAFIKINFDLIKV